MSDHRDIIQNAGPRRLDGPLLRPEQAAELLSVKTSWVYDAARTGRLPCLRVGKHIRFTRPMLEDWLEGSNRNNPVNH